MSGIKLISGPAIDRLLADAEAVYSEPTFAALGIAYPVPRVTLDLPASEPEPNHVFVWPTARDFGVEGLLTGDCYIVSFHVWMTVVATASTAEDAADAANLYQSLAVQMTLCDKTLGGIAYELLAPGIKESDSWADADGRRHAGYLLDYEVHVEIEQDETLSSILAAI